MVPQFLLQFFILICFIYLQAKEKEREKNGQRSPKHWITPELQVTTRGGPSCSQEADASSRSPTQLAGPQLLQPYLLSPEVFISRKLDSGTEPGLKVQYRMRVPQVVSHLLSQTASQSLFWGFFFEPGIILKTPHVDKDNTNNCFCTAL